MEKISFALDIDGDWPPVATESVWCAFAEGLYELKNAPFFIHGLAYGDKFSAELDAVNGLVFDFELMESSGHSLVWALNNDGLDFSISTQELLALGCSVEGFPKCSLHAIDIPASVDRIAINNAVDLIESRGFALAFPVWRHEN